MGVLEDKEAADRASRIRYQRNARTISAAVKLTVFTIISVLVTGLLAAIMGNIGFGAGTEYRAIFTSATSLEKGDDVRIAGVSVGEVREVDHYERNNAMVTFRVKDEVSLTTATQAEIRFLNLVGDRYLALEQGASQLADPLESDDVLPVAQTTPALDLTTLFNGFKPLFQALQPDQVNELTMNIVQVLQGEGGTIRGLLESTSSLTNTLADRDQLIGDVINNFGETLETVDSRRSELSSLVVELKGYLGDLARDRTRIGSSLDSIDDLTVVLADLLEEGRPLLKSNIAELRKLSALLNKPENKRQIEEIFDRLPESMTDQTRTGTYGSWYSYYLCGFSGRISLPVIEDLPILGQLQKQLSSLNFRSTAARCNQ